MPIHKALLYQRGWYVRLRWIAIAGVSLTLLFFFIAPYWGIHFPEQAFHLPALFIVTGILAVLNIGYTIANHFIYLSSSHHDSSQADTRNHDSSTEVIPFVCWTCRLINVQIFMDMIILALLLYFSGGVHNPFIFYFIFHIMIGSFLLRKQTWAFFHTLSAIVMLGGIAFFTYFQLIPSYTLFGEFQNLGGWIELFQLIAKGVAFASTLVIVTYIGIRIRSNLMQQELKLEESYHAIAKLEAAKADFMRMVAHELKSPIAGIQSMLDSILFSQKDTLDETAINFITRGKTRSQNLLELTQELLEYSRLDDSQSTSQSAVEQETIALDALLQDRVDFYQAKASEKSIPISLEMDTPIPTYPGVLSSWEKVVDNLISNAIRYTPNHGSVTVRLINKKSALLFQVQDTGIGIKAEHLPNLFTEFYRTPEAKKFSSEGTGLGLAICKKIVDQAGGTMEVQSEPGIGTLFSVSIPLR